MNRSAGILLYQTTPLRFFLVHPGGPFWKNKDAGAWSIPKGEFFDDEQPLIAAIREFAEETGHFLDPDAAFSELSPVRLKSGKTVLAWALEEFVDDTRISSNEFEMEWPPRSGKRISVPEIDRAGWFSFDEALEKINPAQQGFMREVAKNLQLE